MIRELFSTGFALTLTLGIVHADEGPATPVAGVTGPELVDRCSPGSVPCSQASPAPLHLARPPTADTALLAAGCFPGCTKRTRVLHAAATRARRSRREAAAAGHTRAPASSCRPTPSSTSRISTQSPSPSATGPNAWRTSVGEHWLFSTGGEFRYRYNDESNSQAHRQAHQLQPLSHPRSGDLWYEDVVRLYGEFLFGDITGHEAAASTARCQPRRHPQPLHRRETGRAERQPPLPAASASRNCSLAHSAFSTNDWGNNRHRFQAVKTFYRSKQWDADLFTGRPVQVRFNDLDPGDHDQWFTGAWLTYKAGTFFDLYYLNLDNTTPGVATGRLTGKFNLNTIGGRGTGRVTAASCGTSRAAWSVRRLGRPEHPGRDVHDLHRLELQERALNPTVWVGYDFASGDPDRTRPARDGPSINSLRSVTTISGSWTTWDDRTSTTSPCRRTAIR